ncbi:hypothetical protein ABIA25_001915 [Sinorhizobium fredii]
MTKIWKEGGFVNDDPWVVETEEVKAGSNEKAILGLDAFLEQGGRRCFRSWCPDRPCGRRDALGAASRPHCPGSLGLPRL